MNPALAPVLTGLLVAVAGGAWALVATSRAGTGRRRWWITVAAAVAGTTTAIASLLAAVAAGWWWFVGEKVVVYVPLALAALTWFGVSLLVRRRRGASTEHVGGAPAWAGVIAAAAGLVMQFVVGFPAPAWAVACVVILAVGAAALVTLQLRRVGRRPGVVLSAVVLLVVGGVAATVVIGTSGVGAAAPRAHAHVDEPGPGAEAPDTVSVSDLRTPLDRPPDVQVELRAQQQRVELPSGRTVDAWTFGALGGPVIEATEGDLVEVMLRNVDIASGVTAHWHGYEVPNGEDGVAGVTQDAVHPGQSFTYRFVAAVPGTFWYHTHQRASEGVDRGLYGPLVIHPEDEGRADHDLVLPLHTFEGGVVIGDSDQDQLIRTEDGASVRMRLINTDQEPQVVTIAGGDARVIAIDGRSLLDPAALQGRALRIPAGGRYDVAFEMPSGSVAVRAGAGDVSVVLTTDGSPPPSSSGEVFDPAASRAAAMPPDAADGGYDLERTIVLDRLPRLLAGGPAYAYTVDGGAYPNVAPTVVEEGDRVKLTVVNRGFETHPMHPHGHHVEVLAVNGRPPANGPLRLDTFDVQPGETWEVALTADNPGIWMDHCHNLDHAALGMVTHLAYRGVRTPFDDGGIADNVPE